MGRRSIQTTKSGKFMNPTDQARKEARKRELKKNKKQRKMVREAVLKSKDPQRILEEIEKIDALEIDAGPIPLPNDKALKDKKKKLKETLDRLINLYEKDDPSHSGTVRKLVADSERKRLQAQLFAYETRQRAQEEEDMIPDIPLPTNIPLPHAGMLMPSDIPLPGPLPGQLPLPPGLIPPGPPPGPPPSLPTGLLPPGPPPGLPPPNMPPPGFPPPGVPPPLPPGTSSNDLEEFDAADHDVDDDEDDDDSEGSTSESEGGKEEEYDPEVPLDRMEEDDDHQARESTNNKDQESRERPRTVRFADEVQQSEDGIQAAKNTSSIQDFLLKMAGQQQKADNQGDHTKRNLPQTGQEMSRQSQPPGPPPGPPPIRMPPPGNPPPGVLPIQPNFQIRPPPRMFPPGPPPGRPPGPPPGMPGMVPPGPPPGLPPNMMAHAMVRGPRPLMQQSMPLPPPVRPGMVRPPGPPPGMLPPPHGAVLSAPPTFISKPPVANLAADGGKGATISKEATATISAKPQLRNTQAELTKLIPTALRVKREQPKNKAKPRSSGIGSETIDTVSHHVTQPRVAETGTKDDAYALFMKEMQGLL